jgi:hypothetical protein
VNVMIVGNESTQLTQLQDAGVLVAQFNHGFLAQGVILDTLPRSSARHDILADAEDLKSSWENI